MPHERLSLLLCMIVPTTEEYHHRVAARIGQAIREHREEQGLRQEDLALAAGVSRRLLVAIEAGKPTARLDGLLRILAALGLTLDVSPRPPGGRGSSLRE
jgi:y4mF family transcriptional regulator